MILLVPVVFGAALGWFDLNPKAAEMHSSVGDDSHLLLNGFPDSRLTVEIAYQSSGGPPPAIAVSTLLNRVNETCAKSTTTVVEHPIDSTASSFSLSDLDTLAESERTVWPGVGAASLFYLYLDGSYAGASSVIGLAFLASSIAVFEGTIVASAGAGQAVAVTTTVMVHEFGHELGLVGIVGSAPNEDLSHPGHSNDPNDVMYWSVDSTALLGGILPGSAPPTQFSAADLADLQTVKNTPLASEVLPWVVLGAALVIALVVVVYQRRRRPKGSP